MTEIDALFAKRDAQWSAYCKKRDRSNKIFNYAVLGITFAVVTILANVSPV